MIIFVLNGKVMKHIQLVGKIAICRAVLLFFNWIFSAVLKYST